VKVAEALDRSRRPRTAILAVADVASIEVLDDDRRGNVAIGAFLVMASASAVIILLLTSPREAWEASPRTEGRINMSRVLYVNLPVKDLAAATRFYEAIGCKKNDQFSDEKAASMVWSDTITFQLLTREYFATFTSKRVADGHGTC
jgi:hypothetical protein